MKLSINNFAKIKSIEKIEFDGITLIAGVNNTGKSTISKVLYCVFATLYDIDKQVYNLMKDEIDDYSDSVFGLFSLSPENFEDICKAVLQEKNMEKCKNILEKIDFGKENKDELINTFIEKVNKNLLAISNDKLKNKIAEIHFSNEFNNQYHSILNDNNGKICLSIKDVNLLFDILYNGEINVNDSKFKILHKAYYYDGPSIVDVYSNSTTKIFTMGYDKNHQKFLYDNLKPKNSSLENLNNKKRAKDIFNLFFDTEIEYPQLNVNFKSKNNKFDSVEIKGANEPLRIERLSSGLKTIMVLYNLFCNSIIDEDILILDEPEINLHPEWQVKLAELLVCLRNEFKLTLLISTHSPYFINAIDTYSYKYKVQNKCHYYMANNIKEGDAEYADLREINDADEIYESLYKPFEKLYNEREKITND